MTFARPLRLVLAAAAVALSGCAGLPPRSEAPVSTAWLQPEDTTLGRIAEASLEGIERGMSGFRTLPTGEFAYRARTALAAAAERTLDAQYFHIHDDGAGATFLRELRDAAQRGVRVRLLVDDFHASPIYLLLQGLAATPNAEVRLFNPLPARHGPPLTRMLLSLHQFKRVNQRMHNKLVVADNALAIFGGRNVADEYFMRSGSANFIDIDLLAAGPVVPELSATFDRYWNSEHAWPLHALVPPPDEPQAMRDDFDRRVGDRPLPVVEEGDLDPLHQTSVPAQLLEGRLQLVPGRATVHADPPEKIGRPAPSGEATPAMTGILAVIGAARSEVVIVNPYFLPGEVGMRMMRDAARRGQRAVIVTNSLRSTDEPLVHRAYSRYRVAMLRLGMNLYEVDPTSTRERRRFGNFGSSTSRLHAKAAVVDRRWLLVGSVNLDARSALLNTELAVAIDSPALAGQALGLLAADDYRSHYELRLDADGSTLLWHSTDAGGRTVVTRTEPGSGWWLSFKLWLQSLLVDDTSL